MRIEGEVLTLRQASERTGISHSTLQKQAKNGVLKAQMIGKTWVVTNDELERYRKLHQGRQGFASPSHPYHGKSGRSKR